MLVFACARYQPIVLPGSAANLSWFTWWWCLPVLGISPLFCLCYLDPHGGGICLCQVPVHPQWCDGGVDDLLAACAGATDPQTTGADHCLDCQLPVHSCHRGHRWHHHQHGQTSHRRPARQQGRGDWGLRPCHCAEVGKCNATEDGMCKSATLLVRQKLVCASLQQVRQKLVCASL